MPDSRNYPKLAETVVVSGEPKFQFDVDGKEFPYFITKKGPQVAKLDEDLYQVRVTIMACGTSPDERRYIAASAMNLDGPAAIIDCHENPSFGDRNSQMLQFPWAITQQGVRLIIGNRYMCQATLAFFAKDVQVSGIPIVDLSPRVAEVYDSHGSVWKRSDIDPEIRVGADHVDVKVREGIVRPPV